MAGHAILANRTGDRVHLADFDGVLRINPNTAQKYREAKESFPAHRLRHATKEGLRRASSAFGRKKDSHKGHEGHEEDIGVFRTRRFPIRSYID